MTDVAVHVTARTLAAGSDIPARIVVGGGGAGGNVAAALGRLGAAVGLVARVGDDGAGVAALHAVEQTGAALHAQVDRTVATGTVVALIDVAGERTMLSDRGANRYLARDDLPDDWFRAGAYLHLSGYSLFDEPARAAGIEVLRRAAAAGMSISVDPASWAPLQAFGAARFLSVTSAARLCLPNADEAQVLTGLDDPAAAARRLADHYGTAVVTCGAGGAVWSDGATVRRQPVDEVEVLDSTGAGDVFVAHYLAATIRGAAPAAALARAVRGAATAVGVTGARQ
jgi:sugar/nucleoside kinase (ribokinase family)